MIFVSDNAHQPAAGFHLIAGSIAAEQAAPPTGAQDQNGLPRLHDPVGARGHAGLIHGGDDHLQRDIRGALHHRRTGVQDGLPLHRQLGARIVYTQNPVELQRGDR